MLYLGAQIRFCRARRLDDDLSLTQRTSVHKQNSLPAVADVHTVLCKTKSATKHVTGESCVSEEEVEISHGLVLDHSGAIQCESEM